MHIDRMKKLKYVAEGLFRSPKTAAFLKLGVAFVGVLHALDEVSKAYKTTKLKPGV
jgi:hypothetical protein